MPQRINKALIFSVYSFLVPVLFAQSAGSNSVCPSCGRRQALIIGNDSYPSMPLRNAENDARAIAAKLTSVGFTSELALNVSQAKLEYAIEKFVLGLNAGDVAVFYFSGHGFQLEGENYMVPIDFSANSQVDAKYTSYSVSRVLERMTSRKTRVNLIILDACRDNPFVSSRSFHGGWAPMDGGTGTYIAFATSPGSTASDNPNGVNGLFTKHLIAQISTPGLSLDELFGRVRREVAKESNGLQIPWSASSVVSEFDFAGDNGKSTANLDPRAIRPGGLDQGSGGEPVEFSPDAQAHLVRCVNETSKNIELDPSNAAALVVRGRAKMRLHEFAGALDDFNRAIVSRPDYNEAYRYRGRVLLLLKQPNEANDDLNRCMKADQGDVVALYYRSVTNFQLGQYELAIKDATEIIRQAPTMPEGFLSRAAVYLAQGRMQDAVQDCTRALDLDNGLSVCYAVRGRALQALGRADEAKKDFSRASLSSRRATLDNN